MPVLTNAPLIESNFKVRWHIRNPKEMSNIQFLLGDLYAGLRKKFPRRSQENLGSAPANMVYDDFTHKFQPETVDFPNVKVGSNNLKITITDEYYEWASLSETISETTEVLTQILDSLISPDHYHLYLQYVDFYEFDFDANNIFEFLKNSMHISINQEFYTQEVVPNDIDLEFNYKIDVGDLKFGFMKGRYENKIGLIVTTEVESNLVPPSQEKINEWIRLAHEECSKSFKNMTAGDLYESFE